MEEVISAITGRATGKTRWGVRKSSTAVAVGVVAVALLLGGVLLLVLLQSSLIASTNTTARQKAQSVIVELEDVDVSDAHEYMLATARAGQYVQLLDPAGYVVASSDPIAAYSPLSAQRPGPGRTLSQDVSSLPTLGDQDDFHLVASGSPGGYTVIVAQSTQLRADTIATVAWFMLGATPLLLGIVAGSVWLLVGRSLRQVETIRGQVARIDAERLDERVDVPSTHDEIRALALTMNTMLERLQASDHEQRRFVSDASHELRSPLATLSAGLEIAAADPSGAMWLEMKDVLSQETARMRYLVESLLTLAKANDHGLTLDETDVDLDDIVDLEVRRLRSTSRKEIRAELIPARVRGDANRLAQVLRNVFDNAERHALSRITIRLSTSGDAAIVTVDNDGAPVPEPDRDRIFERFVRLDASRSRESGGSGLGLAIAAGIMTAHRGSIRTSEGPAGQCRFEMVLPAPGLVTAPAPAVRGSRRHRPPASSRR
ncbi:cell wall metabolism sensor histidine kinase WalK [Arthrobacter oryzae]|uniref:histidine kinase n=1 Tax=Arthrobacter oryzae TaxID=409290 RepID=A0A3N0C636_9MICC|nr:HAMP domain-containing sensor histidine kinase [Arthrobacter oryzae]RNL58404.1 sensor histidine kinase [Arthrobacter oryzae]